MGARAAHQGQEGIEHVGRRHRPQHEPLGVVHQHQAAGAPQQLVGQVRQAISWELETLAQRLHQQGLGPDAALEVQALLREIRGDGGADRVEQARAAAAGRADDAETETGPRLERGDAFLQQPSGLGPKHECFARLGRPQAEVHPALPLLGGFEGAGKRGQGLGHGRRAAGAALEERLCPAPQRGQPRHPGRVDLAGRLNVDSALPLRSPIRPAGT